MDKLSVPILRGLISGGLDYGANILVEFEPQSLWHDASLSIATQALKEGIRTQFHVWTRAPEQVRVDFERHGLNVKELEEDGKLQLFDNYTPQTGLGSVKGTMKVSDWSIGQMKAMKASIPEAEKRWLHIDDDQSVALQYNKEEDFIDFLRTRQIPTLKERENVVLWGFLSGTASVPFYRKLESLCDGIVDFRSQEIGGQIEHEVRIRAIHGRTFDSRWRRLRLLESGQVELIA